MHVVGARFLTLEAANAALQALRAAVPVAPGDAAVRPLGSTSYDAPAGGYVLGGRVGDDAVAAAVEILQAHGGNVIERRLDHPARPPASGRGQVVASNPPWTPVWTPAPVKTPTPRQAARPIAPTTTGRLRKRLRRPVARLRVRTARSHRLA